MAGRKDGGIRIVLPYFPDQVFRLPAPFARRPLEFCQNDYVGTREPLHGLSQSSQGKQQPVSKGVGRIDKHDILVPVKAEMLEPVIHYEQKGRSVSPEFPFSLPVQLPQGEHAGLVPVAAFHDRHPLRLLGHKQP